MTVPIPPESVLRQLDALEAHLLLALSTQSNLLISLLDGENFSKVLETIQAVCSAAQVARSSHVVDWSMEEAFHATIELLLSRCFFVGSDGVTELPEVLIIPRIDTMPTNTQTAFKEILRDRQFVLRKQSYLLPRNLVCIGMVINSSFEGAGLSRHLIDYFGLSLVVSDYTPFPSSHDRMPPIIPSVPLFFNAPQLRTYTSDLLSGLRHHPSLHAYLLTTRCSASFVLSIASTWAKLKNATHATDNPHVVYSESGHLQPADVQEVLLSCVGHRLRLREEKERLSSFWGKPGNSKDQGKNVQDIVQDVLSMI